MPFATRTRRTTLLVLAAYLAAHTLGALWHEQLHAHVGAEACCHTHEHTGHTHPVQSDRAVTQEGEWIAAGAQDHACVVCRIAGQPVVPAAAAAVDVSTDICPDALPCPAATPRTLAVRIAHSRAPPTAV